jgi:hypothetical protein
LKLASHLLESSSMLCTSHGLLCKAAVIHVSSHAQRRMLLRKLLSKQLVGCLRHPHLILHMMMNLFVHWELDHPATLMDNCVKLPAPHSSGGPPLGMNGSDLPPGW